MKVPFTLQAVLDYRESIVDLLGRQLGALQAERRAEEERLYALEDERGALLVRWRREQEDRLDVPRAVRYRAYLTALDERIAAGRECLALLDGRIALKRQELGEALKKQEMLETLKDHQRREFLADLDRREALLADELALSRYVREARREGA